MSEQLYPGRFCGGEAKLHDDEAINGYHEIIYCGDCFHEVKSMIYLNAQEIWQARNRLNNPFIKEKKNEK